MWSHLESWSLVGLAMSWVELGLPRFWSDMALILARPIYEQVNNVISWDPKDSSYIHEKTVHFGPHNWKEVAHSRFEGENCCLWNKCSFFNNNVVLNSKFPQIRVTGKSKWSWVRAGWWVKWQVEAQPNSTHVVGSWPLMAWRICMMSGYKPISGSLISNLNWS